MSTDDQRISFAKDFFMRAEEASLAIPDHVVDYQHRVTEGMSDLFNELRFNAYHTSGTEAAIEDCLIKIAALAGRNYRIIAKKKAIRENSAPGLQ